MGGGGGEQYILGFIVRGDTFSRGTLYYPPTPDMIGNYPSHAQWVAEYFNCCSLQSQL